MHFTFQYLRGETPEDILFNPAPNKWFGNYMTVQDVHTTHVIGNEKARSTYLLAMAHKPLIEDIFRGNRVIMIIDRQAPLDKSKVDIYWSNIFRAEAIACDDGIAQYLREKVPVLDKRILNLTGVSVGRSYKTAIRPKGYKRCVFVSEEDNGLWEQLKGCKEAVREGIAWHLLKDESLGAQGVYVTPNAHSQLYLTTLASRCNMLVHAARYECSYNLDPRTNSIALGRLQQLLDNGMLGSSGFETVRDMFYSELSGVIQSLDVNYYMPPIGDTLFDRLFNEVNRSAFE